MSNKHKERFLMTTTHYNSDNLLSVKYNGEETADPTRMYEMIQEYHAQPNIEGTYKIHVNIVKPNNY